MEKAIKRYWPVFVLPTLIAFIIGFVWPFIWGAGLSFCKFTTVKNVQLVGLNNYKMIWIDDTFTHAFWFTAAFTIVSTVLINVLAFSIALLLGPHHPDVLAADRLHDDHLHCRFAERAHRSDRSGPHRRRYLPPDPL